MNAHQALVLYDQMRSAIAKCAAIDEVAGIKDKAQQLEAYARVRDDAESQTQFAEIRLRACIRIGEISRDLEKAEAHGGQIWLPTDGKSKEDQLADVGISTSTAHRYEELAGGKNEQAQAIALEAGEHYFASQRQKQEPATFEGLSNAVSSAVENTLGPPPPPRPKRPKIPPLELGPEDRWRHWINDIDQLEPEDAAIAEDEEFRQYEVDRTAPIIALVERYLKTMKEQFNVTPSTNDVSAFSECLNSRR